MIQEAIDRIVDLAAPNVIEVNGHSYADQELHVLPGPGPQPTAIMLHTLEGLVAYVEDGSDIADREYGARIVVEGPARVVMQSELYGDFEQRDTFVVCTPFLGKEQPTEKYLDIESFVIALQSHFVQDDITAALLKVVGNLTAQNVTTSIDDGVSQTVTTKRGVAGLANVTMPSQVMLRPFRTFQEIQQPASRFVLRMRQVREGELPQIALFEAHDEQWRLEAVKAIRNYLDEKISIPIFA